MDVLLGNVVCDVMSEVEERCVVKVAVVVFCANGNGVGFSSASGREFTEMTLMCLL